MYWTSLSLTYSCFDRCWPLLIAPDRYINPVVILIRCTLPMYPKSPLDWDGCIYSSTLGEGRNWHFYFAIFVYIGHCELFVFLNRGSFFYMGGWLGVWMDFTICMYLSNYFIFHKNKFTSSGVAFYQSLNPIRMWTGIQFLKDAQSKNKYIQATVTLKFDLSSERQPALRKDHSHPCLDFLALRQKKMNNILISWFIRQKHSFALWNPSLCYAHKLYDTHTHSSHGLAAHGRAAVNTLTVVVRHCVV